MTFNETMDDIAKGFEAAGVAVLVVGFTLGFVQAAIRGAVELAALLGIDRVVTMAGCPGGRTGGPIGVFGLWSVSNDDEGIWSWQMEAEVGPYWRELSDWTAATAPDVRICLELHPGVSVYSVDTYRALRSFVGRTILLSLEILVAADLIRTVAVDPTLDNLYVLGLLVLIRTFLSWSLDVELEGVWPWRKRAAGVRSGD